MPRELSPSDERKVAELRRQYAAGANPSDLLQFLTETGVTGVNLIVLMEAAFPTMRHAKVIGVWLAGLDSGAPNHGLVDRRLLPSMPPRDSISIAEMVPPDVTYHDVLRSYLRLSRSELGLSAEDWPHPVHGLIMETTLDEGSFSLLCAADGTVNLYFDNGAHTIGAGDHDPVFEAGSTLMAGAQHHYQMAAPVSDLAPTPVGHARFYFLMDDGPRTYLAREEDMDVPSHPFARFFAAAHEVIGAIRRVEEAHHDAT